MRAMLEVDGVKRDGLILANFSTFLISLPLDGGWDLLTATKALEPFLEASFNDLFRAGTAGTLNTSPIISVMDSEGVARTCPLLTTCSITESKNALTASSGDSVVATSSVCGGPKSPPSRWRIAVADN